jgi:flagellar assembly factor FliW
VFSILTIPEDVTQMTANLKAPLVINIGGQIAKQVVLQENEYSIKHLMFKELRAHLITIASQRQTSDVVAANVGTTVVPIKALPPSLTAKALQP